MMTKKRLIIIMVLTIFIAGLCLNTVSASKTIKMKGYKVKLTNKEINELKNHKYWSIYKSTHKKLKDLRGYNPIYKTKKVKKYKYVYKYRLSTRTRGYESWDYPEAMNTPKGYVYAGTKIVNYENYDWDGYIKYRSKKKVPYYKKVKVKVGKKPEYWTGTVAFSFETDNGKITAHLINDYPGQTGEGGGYRLIANKRIKL